MDAVGGEYTMTVKAKFFFFTSEYIFYESFICILKSVGAAASRIGQYQSGGAAAARNGQYKKAGALPQGDQGSKKIMALPDRKKSGGSAAKRKGQ